MSRIGRLPVTVPAGVTVEIAENNKVTVKGPKGTLVRELPVEMEIKLEEDKVAELKYILARKEAKIKMLEMENELMRDFLSLTERK